jgi:hypothetical protein
MERDPARRSDRQEVCAETAVVCGWTRPTNLRYQQQQQPEQEVQQQEQQPPQQHEQQQQPQQQLQEPPKPQPASPSGPWLLADGSTRLLTAVAGTGIQWQSWYGLDLFWSVFQEPTLAHLRNTMTQYLIEYLTWFGTARRHLEFVGKV